ncbi:hypothetical protein DXV76_08590 [Rhodobacteraceae bacterium CCMM004]|nr:hypothetical protein DXV76_08590 [Rhodobacteraceae bacterium CCMM004]
MSAPQPQPLYPGAPRRCRACHGPLTATDGDHCARPACQTRARVMAAQDGVRRRREAEEAAEAVAWARTGDPLRTAAARAGAPDLDTVAHGFAPYMDLPVQARPMDVDMAFLHRLSDIVARSFDPDGAPDGYRSHQEPPDPDFANWAAHVPDETPALDAACIACQGDCCLQGAGAKAFLTTQTIDYYRHRHPEATAEEVRAAYLGHLPEESVVGSCVYHGPLGCTLPRQMRAEVCNRWQCRWRLALAARLETVGGDRAVVVGLARDHTEHPQEGAPYMRVVSVTPDGVQVHDDLRMGAMPPDPAAD